MKLLRLLCVLAALPAAAQAGSLKILHAFKGGTDGISPVGNLLAQNGALYGATNGGGNVTNGCLAGFGCGLVFRVDAATGTETVLYRFTNSPDGAYPFAGLTRHGHTLYGTTAEGGTITPGDGIVFGVDERTGAETVRASFGGAAAHGSDWPLTAAAGSLFGISSLGGSGSGTVFQVAPSGGLRLVYQFGGQPNDGVAPNGNLVSHDGQLFGTTEIGGTNGLGTVFQLDPATGHETVLHSFLGVDGSEPYTMIYDKGHLYGVSAGGFPNCPLGCGTIFRLDPRTRNLTTLYEFHGGETDGDGPAAIVMLNGMLYGITGAGGSPRGTLCNPYGCGTLFQYDPATNTEKVLHFFHDLANGIYPQGLIVANGVLYGTTLSGGDLTCNSGSGCGTVFSYTP